MKSKLLIIFFVLILLMSANFSTKLSTANNAAEPVTIKVSDNTKEMFDSTGTFQSTGSVAIVNFPNADYVEDTSIDTTDIIPEKTIKETIYPKNFVPQSESIINQQIRAIDTTFDSGNYDNNESVPADPHAAAGLNHVVNVHNNSIQFFDKQGVLEFESSLRGFFSSLQPAFDASVFDPKVIYDLRSNRWVVVALHKKYDFFNPFSWVYVAASDDEDPNGTWYMHKIDTLTVIEGEDSWFDYPGLAVDEEAVYITGNMIPFNGQSPIGQRLMILDKLELYLGNNITADIYNPIPELGYEVTQMPAQTRSDVPAGVGTWLAGFAGSSPQGQFLQLIRINNPLGAITFNQKLVNLGYNEDHPAETLIDAPQPGVNNPIPIETNDRRIYDAVWYQNHLYFTSQMLPNSGENMGQTTAFWGDVDTSDLNNPVLNQLGQLGGEDIAVGAFTYFPSIDINEDGGLAIGFSASSSSLYAGSYFVTRSPSDPLNTVRSSVQLREGLDTYERTLGTSRNRWGDYSTAVLDPDGECFWIHNMHALSKDETLNEGGRWGTAYGQFCNSPPIPVDDAFTIGRGMLVENPVLLTANDYDDDLDDQLRTRARSLHTTWHGQAIINDDGTFTYVHNGSRTSSDLIYYTVCDDGSPSQCSDDSGVVEVTITGGNQPPVANPDHIVVNEGEITSELSNTNLLSRGDEPIPDSVKDNDSDPDDPINLHRVLRGLPDPLYGTLDLNSDNGRFTYQHDGSENFTDSFGYVICDPETPQPLCDEAIVTIQINPVNDIPMAVDDTILLETGGITNLLSNGQSTLLSNDIDDDIDEMLTAELIQNATNGTATVNPDGTFIYIHNGNSSTEDSFEYLLCDDEEPTPECDSAFVNVFINDLIFKNSFEETP